MNALRRARTTLVGAVVATTSVACTTMSAGTPAPVPGMTGSAGAAGQQARPRELEFRDVPPCSLVPESDYDDYHLDEPGREVRNSTYDAPECAWDGTDVGYFSLVLVASEGIEQWRDGDRVGVVEEADPIFGYPAVTSTIPDDGNACFTAVDVADGSVLLVQVGIDTGKLSSVPPVCEYAHRFATSAMSGLVEWP